MKWLRNLFAKAASFFSFAPTWVRYAFTAITYDKLIREGYKINSAVSACVTTLAFSFPEPPLIAGYEEDGRFIADYSHPIRKLLKNPNPDMGEAEMMQFVITYAATGGNLYLWKQRTASRKVLHLWPFSDAQMTPIAGHSTEEGLVAYYEYDAGDGQKIPVSKQDVIHWKFAIDPLNPWKGIGGIELSAREVDKDNEASGYIFALLKNNAVPPVVITLEEDDDSTQEEIDAMGRKWIQKHGQGQPAFIGHGMKVEQMGYDLNKLAADTLLDIPETRIAANFRVPPSVAGLNVGVKRSDYGDAAARRAFTEQTLMALWRSFAAEVLNGLKEDFNLPDNFVLQFDLRRVGALQEEESKRWERITLAFDRGAITRAMMKEMLGLKPEPGDAVYKVSLATEFVPAEGSGVVDRSQDTGNQVAGSKATPSPRPSPNAKAAFGEGSQNQGQEEKAKRRAMGRTLQRIRKGLEGKMAKDVQAFFDGLAKEVVARAQKGAVGLDTVAEERHLLDHQRGNLGGESKGLPTAEDLLDGKVFDELGKIIKRYYVAVMEASWETWNAALGVELAFDLTDPLVTKILAQVGSRVIGIEAETLKSLRETLQHGNENGWSIEDLVRGDEEHPGLRDLIEATYKGRAETIARTELAEAQNAATAGRYAGAGVEKVEILDNGADDDDGECKLANGQIWSLAYFTDNLLEHPNCTRAAAPYFGDGEPDRS